MAKTPVALEVLQELADGILDEGPSEEHLLTAEAFATDGAWTTQMEAEDPIVELMQTGSVTVTLKGRVFEVSLKIEELS